MVRVCWVYECVNHTHTCAFYVLPLALACLLGRIYGHQRRIHNIMRHAVSRLIPYQLTVLSPHPTYSVVDHIAHFHTGTYQVTHRHIPHPHPLISHFCYTTSVNDYYVQPGQCSIRYFTPSTDLSVGWSIFHSQD